MSTKQPYIHLVGAGLGAPDLISVRGLNAIKNADAILYDALVDKQLLTHAKKDAKILFVGKRSYQHSYKQEEINQLIVEYAYQYGNIVRLKGGDPFVFGRGKEETDYIDNFGIPYEIVPGISSSIGAATLSNIPLTKRGVNESFFVVTATTKENQISNDLFIASQSSATVVILMGTRKIKEIQQLFLMNKKNRTPVAFIENASMPNHRTLFTNVKNMYDEAVIQNLKSPAIILVGESIKPELELSTISKLTNHGKH